MWWEDAIVQIYQDEVGRYVNAVTLRAGVYVEGHDYVILDESNPDNKDKHKAFIDEENSRVLLKLQFQQGAEEDYGVNGITSECLLKVLIHRTDYLNQRYPCVEHGKALIALKMALKSVEKKLKTRLGKEVNVEEIA